MRLINVLSFLGKRYNKSHVLPTAELKRLRDMLDLLEEGDLFTIKEVFEFKYFCRCLGCHIDSMASISGENGEDTLMGGVTPVVADEGESHHS